MSQQTTTPALTTTDFLSIMRTEIESGVLDKALSILEPKIKEMLYRNILVSSEAAKYLKVSSATLNRLVKDNDVPHFYLRGSLRFRQWELDEFISMRMIRKSS